MPLQELFVMQVPTDTGTPERCVFLVTPERGATIDTVGQVHVVAPIIDVVHVPVQAKATGTCFCSARNPILHVLTGVS